MKIIALSIRNYTIIKVVQVIHNQGDVRYGTPMGIQCWALIRSPGLWNKLDLEGILSKGSYFF